MLTNRERGDRFDMWVLAQLEPYVTNLRATIGSGSVFGDQDQYCDEFRISCKLRSGRGLTKAEMNEPYGRESISVLRCPLTVLRVIQEAEGEFEWLDYVVADAPTMIAIYSRHALIMAMGDRLDFEILHDWPAGLSLGLLRSVLQGRFLIVDKFPGRDTCSFVFTFKDFMDVLADLVELRRGQAAPVPTAEN